MISRSLIAFQRKSHGYDRSAMVPLFIHLSEKVEVSKVIGAKLGCSAFF